MNKSEVWFIMFIMKKVKILNTTILLIVLLISITFKSYTLLREKIRTVLPPDYKSRVNSNLLHSVSGVLITSEQTNCLNASIRYSSLVDILRSIDTFTMLCGYLKNPFVVTTFINSMLPRFKPSPLSQAYIIKQIFKLNKEKK